jgi:hypothetical protein
MKKFGTPSGAGPGLASEKVGFCGVGLPSGLVNRSEVGDPLPGDPVPPRDRPFGPDAGCSDPWTGAPDEPRRLPPGAGCADGAGEDGLEEGGAEPPEGGDEDGGGDGVTGVGGSGTGGVGIGRLGT